MDSEEEIRRSDAIVSRSPDRVVLTEVLIPALARAGALDGGAEVLWIGCRGYTQTYYSLLERRGARCWTLDVDPTVCRWAHPTRHVVGDMRQLPSLFPALRFDTVLCNGIFGFGVDAQADRRTACVAMAEITKPQGWLLLGWNSDRGPDPRETNLTNPWFESTSLPGFGTRRAVQGCTHVYDIFRRAADAQ